MRTLQDLLAEGYPRTTAARWIRAARREGRAVMVDRAIGSGAVRKVWAMVVTSAPGTP